MIALGGAIGAVLRFAGSNAVYSWLGRDFPYGTLMVNILGSFLMGLLAILFIERLEATPELRAFILIGVLGAFTTFSTFSIETFYLIEQGEVFKAGLNMLLSVVLCVIAVSAGVFLGREL
jgi:CrcB protein